MEIGRDTDGDYLVMLELRPTLWFTPEQMASLVEQAGDIDLETFVRDALYGALDLEGWVSDGVANPCAPVTS